VIKRLFDAELEVKFTNTYIRIKLFYIFILNLLLVLLVGFSNIYSRISTDGYYWIDAFNNAEHVAAANKSNGRILFWLIWEMIRLLRIHPVINANVFYLFYVVALSLSIVILLNRFVAMKDDVTFSELVFFNLCFLFCYVNIPFQELIFYEIAVPTNIISVICLALSVEFFFRFTNSLGKFLSSLFLFINISIYQIYFFVYIVVILAFILFESHLVFNKYFWKQFLSAVIVSGICLIALFISTKLQLALFNVNAENVERYFTVTQIKENVFTLLYFLKHFYFLNSDGGWGNYFAICYLIIFLGLFLGAITKNIKFLVSGKIFLFFAVSFFISFSLHLFINMVWPVPRQCLGLGFTIALTFLLIGMHLKERLFRLWTIITSIIVIITIYHTNGISVNQYANNRIDQEIAQNINYRIIEYEKQNDFVVEKIAFSFDEAKSYGYYGNVNYIGGDINIKAMIHEWDDTQILSYYGHRTFIEIPMDSDIYHEYFEGKNWDYYKPEEQLVFMDNTLYMCIY
jgi:hypothetical protein